MDAASLLGTISSVISIVMDHQQLTDGKKQDARIALSNAFHATEGYYAELMAGSPKSLTKEHELAHLWNEVSIRVDPYDHNLASRLGIKSRYWRESANWSEKQIAEAKIGLESIRQDTNFLLAQR